MALHQGPLESVASLLCHGYSAAVRNIDDSLHSARARTLKTIGKTKTPTPSDIAHNVYTAAAGPPGFNIPPAPCKSSCA